MYIGGNPLEFISFHQNCNLVASSGFSASFLLFRAIIGALGQTAISITAVVMAGDSPCPSGVRSSSKAASGRTTQVANTTRMISAGLCLSKSNCWLGRFRPRDTMMKNRAREIRIDIRTGEDAVVYWKRLGAQINPDSSSRKAITPITSTAVAVAIESDGSSR